MDTAVLSGFPVWLVVLVTVWSLPWKGLALWKAAQLSHKKWFILLLLVNTLGILDIIYIRFVARKYTVETIEG
ncbi:MAG: DUF5652 family protein [Nitrospira sp.]